MNDPIEAIPPIKRRKTGAQQLFAEEFVKELVWTGAIAPHHFAKLVFESGERIVDATISMSQRVRKDHAAASYKRFIQTVQYFQKYHTRNVVIIP